MSMSFAQGFPHINNNFLESLFGECFIDHPGFFEFRIIRSEKEHTIQYFHKSLNDALSDTSLNNLDVLNKQDWNIYFGICPRIRESGTKADVAHATALWADLDAKDYPRGKTEALERLLSFKITPSAIIDSGHGYHAYWFLSEIVDVTDPKRLEGCIKGIEHTLGSDSIHDVNRVMRLPGFRNVKEVNAPLPCFLLEEHFFPEYRYALQDFMHLWVDPGEKTLAAKLNDMPKEIPPRFFELLKSDSMLSDTWHGRRKMPNDNSRSGFDMSLAQQLKHHGFSDGEIAVILLHSPSGKGEIATQQYLACTIGKAKIMPDEIIAEQDLIEMLGLISKEIPKHSLPDALDDFFHMLAREPMAKISSMLRYAVKDRFELTNDDIKAYEKTVISYKKEVALKVQDMEDEQAETFTDEELAAGKKVLQSPSLLHDILSILRRSGLVGEERNALIHYLGFTSRLLNQPISITVKGDSSAGKSFTLGKVMALMPKSAFNDLTDATPQSFYYGQPDQFKHRIIVIFERHGAERADYTMRSLQSEGKLKIQVTIKNPATNQFETKTIEREGPAGFITTTTSSQIHAENETRNLSIFPDQTNIQTQRIYAATNDRYLGKPKLSESEIRPFQAAQTLLKGYPVLIPFVEGLDTYFPKEILRTRRDYPRFLSIIEASTLLHQEQREKIEVDGVIYLKATLADYGIARCLAESSLARSIHEIPPKTLELIDVIKAFFERLPKGNEEQTFTITDIAKDARWDRDTVAKWLEPAQKKTLVTQTEEAKGRKGARYRLEQTNKKSDDFLPSVDAIAHQNPDEPKTGIYNPLTGELVEIKMVETVSGLQAAGLVPEAAKSGDLVTDMPTV